MAVIEDIRFETEHEAQTAAERRVAQHPRRPIAVVMHRRTFTYFVVHPPRPGTALTVVSEYDPARGWIL